MILAWSVALQWMVLILIGRFPTSDPSKEVLPSAHVSTGDTIVAPSIGVGFATTTSSAVAPSRAVVLVLHVFAALRAGMQAGMQADSSKAEVPMAKTYATAFGGSTITKPSSSLSYKQGDVISMQLNESALNEHLTLYKQRVFLAKGDMSWKLEDLNAKL